MDATRFDCLVAALSGGASRRHVLRWFGATAAGGLTAVTGLAGSEAKKKKRKKRKGQQCQPGKLFASIDVPATGVVCGPNLKNGQRYLVRASGYWGTNDVFGNDAYASFERIVPNNFVKVYEGVRIGLSADGGSPDRWGSGYNPNHVYEHEITGRGEGVTLEYVDPYLADNSGSLLVEFFCA